MKICQFEGPMMWNLLVFKIQIHQIINNEQATDKNSTAPTELCMLTRIGPGLSRSGPVVENCIFLLLASNPNE
jgi:hypothetical protein